MPTIHLDKFGTKNQSLSIFDVLESSTEYLYYKVCKDLGSYQCSHYNTDILFLLSMINDKKIIISSILQSIEDLIPKIELPKQNDRTERSLLPVIGRIWESVFGNPSETSFAILANQVAALSKNQKIESDVLIKMNTDFSSMLQVSQSRVDGLIRLVTDTVENVTNLLDTFQAGLTIQLKFINELDLKTAQISHQLNMLENYCNNFLTNLQILINGNIPSTFLPLQVVQSSL